MKDRWSQLSMSEKSDLMSLYIKNGISSLEEIKKHYNSFATGGQMNTNGSEEDEKRDNPPATHVTFGTYDEYGNIIPKYYLNQVNIGATQPYRTPEQEAQVTRERNMYFDAMRHFNYGNQDAEGLQETYTKYPELRSYLKRIGMSENDFMAAATGRDYETNSYEKERTRQFNKDIQRAEANKANKLMQSVSHQNPNDKKLAAAMTSILGGVTGTGILGGLTSVGGLGNTVSNATNIALQGSKTALGAAGKMMLPSTWTTAAGISSGLGAAADATMFTDMVYHGGKNLLNYNNWQSNGIYNNDNWGGWQGGANLLLDLASVAPITKAVKGGVELVNGATNFTRNFGRNARIASELNKAIKTTDFSGDIDVGNRNLTEHTRFKWGDAEIDDPHFIATQMMKTLNPDKTLGFTLGPNGYVRDGSRIPTLDEILNPGMQFIRALKQVPIVNENGFVELVPKDNMLANFATDMRAAAHHDYRDLYELPSLMFINESQLKGITPFSIKPSDTFFRASDLRHRFKPQDITYWSFEESMNDRARALGFNVPKTPADLLAARDAHRATIKDTKDGKGKVSLLERLKRTEQEKGDRDLGEKANLLRRQFEQSLYRRPSLEDYKRLETKTGLKADVTESEISKLNKIVDEYKNAKDDINKIEELYKKYGDDPIITLSDGTSFGHDDFVTLSFGTDNTVGDRLSEMLNATLDHRYDKIYYDKASPIESELMKSIGMGSHPRSINGRVVGAKGVGDMSLEEFNEALNNLRKKLGAKPLAKGGLL